MATCFSPTSGHGYMFEHPPPPLIRTIISPDDGPDEGMKQVAIWIKI
jgi:hypothetical protein